MGQTFSPDLLPPGGISLTRARHRSSNAALTTARYHGRSSGRSFQDEYEVEYGTVLGRGRHTTVVCAHGRINQRSCAVKMFHTQAMREEGKSLMAAEVEIHLTLDHPNIVRLYDVYEGKDDTVYMVMEHCAGGELFTELAAQGFYSEERAAEATRQMLDAVCYLHSHGVAHRDLKLENFIYADAAKRTLKLIDFGFATVWDGSHMMQAACGTPDYVSPEVLNGDGYTSQCDMWSLGVLVFMLLCGRAPLYAERREVLHGKIRRGQVDWKQLAKHGTVSTEAMDFLRSLLVVDPERRMDAQTAMFHPWLVKMKAGTEESIRILPSIFRSLKQYAYGPPLRRAVLQLVAQQLSEEEAQGLTELFLSLSRSGRGTISLEQLRENVDPQMRLFAVLDVNQDGQVHYSEFLAASLSSLPSLREEVLRAAFEKLDGARTGCPGSEELWTVFDDAFEGVDAEALLRDSTKYGVGLGEGIDFEAFKRIVEGAEVAGSPCFEDLPHAVDFVPAPMSPCERLVFQGKEVLSCSSDSSPRSTGTPGSARRARPAAWLLRSKAAFEKPSIRLARFPGRPFGSPV